MMVSNAVLKLGIEPGGNLIAVSSGTVSVAAPAVEVTSGKPRAIASVRTIP
jgi:hypothetical protein